MLMLSPTENQPSKNMKNPARMSVRNRCAAKPTSTTISDAPATVPLRPPKLSAPSARISAAP